MDQYTACLMCPDKVFLNNITEGVEQFPMVEFKKRLQFLCDQRQLKLQLPDNATWEALPICGGCKGRVNYMWDEYQIILKSEQNMHKTNSEITTNLYLRMAVKERLAAEKANLGVGADEFHELTEALSNGIATSVWAVCRPQTGSVVAASNVMGGSSMSQNAGSSLSGIPIENGSTFTTDGAESARNIVAESAIGSQQVPETSTGSNSVNNRKRVQLPPLTYFGAETAQEGDGKRKRTAKENIASKFSFQMRRGTRSEAEVEVELPTSATTPLAGSCQTNGCAKAMAKIAQSVVKESTAGVKTRNQLAALKEKTSSDDTSCDDDGDDYN